ncbi:transcriptional regulator [Erwiniaceae bacterium CAU 1747]
MDNRIKDRLNDISYIIDHRIVFYPGQHRLVYHSEGEEVNVNIFIPTSRCLLLLLQGDKKIIRREEFINKVWVENGCYVANNTFYQNISMLRKLLKKAGLGEDTIITVPKRGLKINNNTHVEITRSERVPSKYNSSLHQKIEKDISANNPIYPAACSINHTNKKQYINKKVKSMFYKFIISSLLLGGAIGALMADVIINLDRSVYGTQHKSDIRSAEDIP